MAPTASLRQLARVQPPLRYRMFCARLCVVRCTSPRDVRGAASVADSARGRPSLSLRRVCHLRRAQSVSTRKFCLPLEDFVEFAPPATGASPLHTAADAARHFATAILSTVIKMAVELTSCNIVAFSPRLDVDSPTSPPCKLHLFPDAPSPPPLVDLPTASPAPASLELPTPSRPHRQRGRRGGRCCQRAQASAIACTAEPARRRPPLTRVDASTQTTPTQHSASLATPPPDSLPHVALASPLLAPPLATPAASLPLCTSRSPSDACLTVTAPPSRRITHVARFVADSMSLGASAPPPLTFGSVVAANTLHLPSAQAVSSHRRISVLHLPSTKAAESPWRPAALLLPSAQAVACPCDAHPT
eukprot:5409681-Pleurochrysis_carterae.AAC.4